MGSWGTGVFQNDHALDLYSFEVDRLIKEVESVLAIDSVDYTDIEGPLIYPHLLSVLATQHALHGLTRVQVQGWAKRYLHIFDSTTDPRYRDALQDRRRVIVATFDSLLSTLPEVAVPPARPTKATPKKRSKPAASAAKKKAARR